MILMLEHCTLFCESTYLDTTTKMFIVTEYGCKIADCWLFLSWVCLIILEAQHLCKPFPNVLIKWQCGYRFALLKSLIEVLKQSQ